MPIPKFEDFLYPFLYQLKDKDVSTKDMKSALIKHFGLSDEESIKITRELERKENAKIRTREWLNKMSENWNDENE